jgi:hypothetical protein
MPPVAPNYRHNFDLFQRAPDLFERADLLGETTLSIDFAKVTYLSDANWCWRRYACFKPGSKGQPTSLDQITHDLVRRDAGLYITFHPQQWFAHPASTLFYRTRNRAGRHMLPLIKKLKQH